MGMLCMLPWSFLAWNPPTVLPLNTMGPSNTAVSQKQKLYDAVEKLVEEYILLKLQPTAALFNDIEQSEIPQRYECRYPDCNNQYVHERRRNNHEVSVHGFRQAAPRDVRNITIAEFQAVARQLEPEYGNVVVTRLRRQSKDTVMFIKKNPNDFQQFVEDICSQEQFTAKFNCPLHATVTENVKKQTH